MVLLYTSIFIKYCKSVLIRKHEMFFVTALLALYLLPHIRSVKVVIDGTIDFGPNWNFEYKLKPINGFEPRKRTSDNLNALLNIDNVDTEAPEQGNEAVTTEIFEDTKTNNVITDLQDNSSDGEIIQERVFDVTRMYKTDVNSGAMFKTPRKIKEETEVVKFIIHIKNESLKMFDNVREKLDDKSFVQKINELKDKYANKFSEFGNNTKNHTIRTAFGNKKVILNIINYSNKLLNRLVNRFKIDIEDSRLRSGFEASKTFQEHKDHLRNVTFEDACRMFDICRAGTEFSDNISDLITTLLEHDDVKVQLAVEAIVKALKRADFSRIMDAETYREFNKRLSMLEELNPFELRVLLMAFKLVIDNRHQPFLDKGHKQRWVKATVAMFHVMEGFNKRVVLDAKDWNITKKDFNRWLADDDINISDVANKLVDRVQNRIDDLDNRTANDFKAKLKLCMSAKSLRINLSSYVQFQPFVI